LPEIAERRALPLAATSHRKRAESSEHGFKEGRAVPLTDAWVLHPGSEESALSFGLCREPFELPRIRPDQVLIEPIYGCWEANMSHAIARKPIDICRERGEDSVVLGNAGVVRVLEAGPAVTLTRPGDLCLLVAIAVCDEWGYPTKVMGYDAPNSMGILARQAV